MNKKIVASISICLLLIITGVGFYVTGNNVNSENVDIGLSIEELKGNNLTEEEKIEIAKSKQKIETLRKKVTLKGLIAKGDVYFGEQEYSNALIKYLQVYNEIPHDQEVNRKIGDIYFELNKFGKAYSYYSKIKEYKSLNKRNLTLSYINSSNVGSGNIIEINQNIDTFGLSEEENFYYKNSMICSFDFHMCRKNFGDYFKKYEPTESGSGTKIIEFEELAKINDAITNYDNFQMEDLTYKSALISGAYFQNGFYWAALSTARNILKDSPDYKPILKIAAKSSYELGNYVEAKKYLIKHNKVETDDPEVSYFLGIIYGKLNENILSTIHLKKAERIGYPDLINIKRRLIFAYYELGQSKKMLEVFEEIIKEKYEGININDYSLAIYYNIVEGDLTKAISYARMGKKLFPESEIFYGYFSWLLLQNEELSDYQMKIIESNIGKALDRNDKNPMILMVKGILEFRKENNKEAFSYFKKALGLDKNGDFKEIIKSWLDKIPKEDIK